MKKPLIGTFAMICASSVIHSAVAAPRQATEANNKALKTELIALTSTNIAGTLAGLTPAWFGLPGELLAMGADIQLKRTPPVFAAPGEIKTDPNAIDYTLSSTESCVFRVGNPQNYDGDFYNWQESGASIFFVNFDKIENAWSELQSPYVYHPNADYGVKVYHPDLKQNTSAYFPAGHYQFDWQARTYLNYVTDVALPVALMATFNYAEHKYGRSLEAAKVAKLGKSISKQAARDAAERTAYLRFLPINIASELGLIGVDVSGVAQAMEWYDDTTVTTAINSGTQSLTVWDNHPPYFIDAASNTVIESQSTTLEATDFGGVRLGRTGVIPDLRGMFRPMDDCGSVLSLRLLEDESTLLKVDETNAITWELFDQGPYQVNFSPLASNQTQEGERIIARLIQYVDVVDTQAPLLVPPAGFARYSDTPIDLTTENFLLGRPRVVDLADPSIVVGNNAPDLLEVDRRYAVEWFAEDSSGNVTEPPPENPDAYTQYITIKSPGTNTAPTAQDKSAETITSQEVEITLTGIDTDFLDGRFDPLEFEIDQYPENGELKSPLYPFFIEDFRLSPVGDNEEIEDNEIVRTSPLQHLADEFRLLDVDDRGQFLEEQICNAAQGSTNQQVFNKEIPVDFVYEPEYVHVNDEGEYFILDYFFHCDVTEFSNEYPWYSFELPKIPRISKWSKEGALLAMHELTGILNRDYPSNTMAVDTYPHDEFNYDENGRIWFRLGVYYDHIEDSTNVISFDSNLQDLTSHGVSPYVFFAFESTLRGIATDVKNGLLYENHSLGLRVFPYGEEYQIQPIPDFYDYDDPAICEHFSCIGISAIDIEVDSEGYVYALNYFHNRVDKFEPAYQDANGDWRVGEHIGWMGSCVANKTNEFGVPYGACNESLGRSNGYQCTTEKCVRADGDDVDTYTIQNGGSELGQFQYPRNIEIDPHDTLYVSDTGNSRVQRFGPDGTFVGVANSTGTGVNQGDDPGFVLGNMGRPDQISVNSSSLHVMSPYSVDGDQFVHVFKSIPFYEVTDSSAVIKYVSKFNFQGTDTLTYYVDDGIDESGPATVNIHVARAYRAPEKLTAQCYADEIFTTEIPCAVDEDRGLVIRLSAEDLDGFISTGGLDTHIFSIVDAPTHGQLTQLSAQDNAAIYQYSPSQDFNGSDEFSFNVFDGALTSEDTLTVPLTIAPTPDPVVVDWPSDFKAARGFERVISAEYSDVDEDLQSMLTSLNWGDGSLTERDNSWINSGRTDSHGTEINPQTELGVANGVLIGGHLYSATGNYNVSATLENMDNGGSLPPTMSNFTIEVIDATVVGAELVSPAEPVDPATTFALSLAITNHLPQGWAGLEADNVQVSIEIPEEVTIESVDGLCSLADSQIDCELGDLTQGESIQLNFTANIELEAAREFGSYPLQVTINDDGPHINSVNKGLFGIHIADEDDDGAIDVDDAFPGDARYDSDNDGDGLANLWEIANGFDPDVADDVTQDVDGDGFNLLQEFEHDSSPYLAELQIAAAAAPLESDTNVGEDRFGQAIAGGDLNLDGYDDLVIGAPSHDGSGAAFVAYGSEDGADSSYQHIAPLVGQTAFGRSVAVDDFDGNGYPDIAVGGSNDVSIYFNYGEILDYADLVLTHPDAGNGFGNFLTSGDVDGDGIADLVVTARSGSAGGVFIYLSGGGGLAGAPARFVSATNSVGDSATVADIDGDTVADVLAGASGNGDGVVYAFLGADNSWVADANLIASFQLNSPGTIRFGFSIASGADIGGDDIDDLVIGAYSGRGTVYVYGSADLYWQVANVGDTSNTAPAQTINGLDDGSQPGDSYASGDQFGVRVAMGHLDTDTFADVVVGANRTDLDDKGQVQIFRGSATGLVTTPQIENGATAWDMLGYFVTIAGDINGDGFNDIAAGAPDILTGTNPSPNGGYVQLYYHSFTAVDLNDDIDSDGVGAGFDNCPDDANTNQADLDGDNIGDVCDSDIDGDGFDNDSDNCPLLSSSDLTDSDADGLGNLCDDDDDNDTVFDEDDAFPTLSQYSADGDGDGLPDNYESDNGLNPNDGSDATADLDGDGRNNLDEFNQGSDVTNDDIAPQLTIPAAIVVNSTGPLTPVSLGGATAVDAKDGTVNASVDNPGPFRPGRHIVTWQAVDAAGNTATGTQQVDVIPQVNFVGKAQYVAEQNSIKVQVVLNGDAVHYPVTVPFSIGGSADNGSDYSLLVDSVEIAEASATIAIDVLDDGIAESLETIVLSLEAPTNAVAGTNAVHTVNIVEENVAPRLDLVITQNHLRRSTVAADAGAVTMSVAIDDANLSDAHSIDWSMSDPALQPGEGYDSNTFTFIPALLVDGVYPVVVTVADNGTPNLTATAKRWLKIVSTTPVLSDSTDSDGDGESDASEGFKDQNQNGIDDYLEAAFSISQLIGETDIQSLLQTDEGLTLSMGQTAAFSGNDAMVSTEDIANYGSGGGPALTAGDDIFDYPLGLFDFEVSGLAAAGENANVVIPLTGALPADAVYRKYLTDIGWRQFVIDANNGIASAAGNLGACPSPGSSDYQSGMAEGDYCVQLTIEDGGPNDLDGSANGVIVDPSGAAIVSVAAEVTMTLLPAADQSVTDGSTDVVVLRFQLDSNVDSVSFNQFTLEASGSGNDLNDVSAVVLWIDNNRNGSVDSGDTELGNGNYQANDSVLQLQLDTPYALPLGATDFIVSYDF